MRHFTVPILATSLLTTFLLSHCAIAAPKQQRTTPGSFLAYQVRSVKELVQQVKTVSYVRARYARHFHISPDRVASYLSSNLKMTTLQKTVTVQLYYVGKDNRTHVKSKQLPKGTPVFARNDGTPMLSAVCGNPLSAPRAMVKPQKVAVAPMAPVDTKVLAEAPEVVIAPPVEVAPGLTVIDVAPIAQLAVIEALPVAAAPAIASGIKGLSYIGGVAGLVAGLSNDDTPDITIPEPSGLLALSGLLGSMAAIRIRRRSSLH